MIIVNDPPYQMRPEAWVREQMRGRFSRCADRRAAAHFACLEMLRRHEVALGEREEYDWVPKPVSWPSAPPKPADAARAIPPS